MKYMIGNYTKKRLNQKIVIDVNILSYVQVNWNIENNVINIWLVFILDAII